MAQQRSHQDYRTGGVVSIWLGSIGIEDDLDDYLADDFPDDFGFEIEPEDGPEFDIANPARPVADLLDGFSCGEDFYDEAVQAAKDAGWERANCVLVFYNFAYEPTTSSDDAPLVFLGTFPFGFEDEDDE
jgi:hypothetical protein